MIRIFLIPWRLYEESAATITLNGEISICISLKTDAKKNLTTVTLTVEHCPGVPHQLHKDRKRDLSKGREELKLTACKNKKRIWKKNWQSMTDQNANIHWIVEKGREFQKNIYFCFIDYAKAFDCVDHKNWKILKEMGISNHLTCLLRNLYVGQEATVRTRHGRDWFKIGKGVYQGYILI